MNEQQIRSSPWRGQGSRPARSTPRCATAFAGPERPGPWLIIPAAVATLLLAVGHAGKCAAGVELRLRAQCQPAGPLVRLADLAEIVAADAATAQRLAAVELFPAPVYPAQRYLSTRELEDLLLLRGISPAEYRLSGSSQVVIQGRGNPGPAATLSNSAVRKAHQRVEEALKEYLDKHAAAPTTWRLDFQLTAQQLQHLWPPTGRITVSGGRAPWSGPQVFELQVDTPTGTERLRIEAKVESLPAVVVAARSLPPGTVIRPGDVRLETGIVPQDGRNCFHRIEQVVGHETTRALPAGGVLDPEFLRAPLLVHRGEVVTVYSRAAGVRVRTTARARDDASLGELVEVESLWSRDRYLARVCGLQEVEVFARPAQAAPTARGPAAAPSTVQPARTANALNVTGPGSNPGAGSMQHAGNTMSATGRANTPISVAGRPLRAPVSPSASY